MEPEGSLPHSKEPANSPYHSQLDPVHTPTSYFLKIYLNIILPFTTESPKWSFSLRFPYQNPEYASPIPNLCYFNENFFFVEEKNAFAERSHKRSKNWTTVFFVGDTWRSGVTDPSIPGFLIGMTAVVGFIRQLLYSQEYCHHYRSHRNRRGSHSLSGSRGKYRNLCQCRETNCSPLIVHRGI